PTDDSRRSDPAGYGSATCWSVRPCVPHPRVPGSKRAYLFLLVDDYSRLLLHGRWVPDQNTRAGQEVLRAAIHPTPRPARTVVCMWITAHPTPTRRSSGVVRCSASA